MSTRTITVFGRCQTPECNKVLHSIAEGERGTCATCRFRQMKPETKAALNRVIAAAFDGSNEPRRNAAIDDAVKKLREERPQ